jgi:small subunit ribosomal protein S20
MRQNPKRQARNVGVKSALKTARKKTEILIEEKKSEEAKTAVAEYYKLCDKAAVKGIIPKNTAARRKSRITLRLNSISKSA